MITECGVRHAACESAACGSALRNFNMLSPLYDFIDRLPKVELHLHLEGSVEPPVLRQLSGYAGQDAESLYRYDRFYDFLMAFKTVCLMLRSPADFERVTYDLLARLARQQVHYAEVFFSPSIHRRNGLAVDRVFEALYRGRDRARAEFGIETALLLDSVRQWGVAEARYVMDLAVEHRGTGVVGIGIGGDEVAAPPELFREIYEDARARGLHAVAHAGEAAGAASVWGALRALGAERIGHGVRAAEDPALVDYLRDRQVPVEVCLTSNRMTGLVASWVDHPVRRFFDAGLRVTLHTDDPAMFRTTLTAEYRLLADHFHFTAEEIRQVARHGVLAAFLPEARKVDILREIDAVAL